MRVHGLFECHKITFHHRLRKRPILTDRAIAKVARDVLTSTCLPGHSMTQGQATIPSLDAKSAELLGT